jgi:hypothetical protein
MQKLGSGRFSSGFERLVCSDISHQSHHHPLLGRRDSGTGWRDVVVVVVVVDARPIIIKLASRHHQTTATQGIKVS